MRKCLGAHTLLAAESRLFLHKLAYLSSARRRREQTRLLESFVAHFSC